MPQIIIEIDQTGETTVKAEGVAGRSCKDLTRNIERALGRTVSDAPTGEMWKTEVGGGQTQVGG